MDLTLGANTSVPTALLELHIELQSQRNLIADVSAYVLAESTLKVSGDDDMIFYGQLRNQAGTVCANLLQTRSIFTLDLTRMAAGVGKVAFSATLDQPQTNFSAFDQITLQIKHNGLVIASAKIPTQGMQETALILGEFYLRQGVWKFRVVGQGFNGGLKPLAEHFGVQIAVVNTAASADVASKPFAASTAVPKPISLSKISLDKSNKQISLEKKGNSFGEIKVNLNWNQKNSAIERKSFFSKLKPNKGIDLDLGCLYEMNDGKKGVVQALGNAFGDLSRPPYIKLAGDDRTGSVQDGEWLVINGQYWSEIKRIAIYAFIYEGAPNWATTDGVVTVYVPDQPPIEVKLTEGASNQGMCAVVLLENNRGAFRVSREVRYFKGHQELDTAYGWDMRWKSGSK
jgi:tellurite resistance protein TerA